MVTIKKKKVSKKKVSKKKVSKKKVSKKKVSKKKVSKKKVSKRKVSKKKVSKKKVSKKAIPKSLGYKAIAILKLKAKISKTVKVEEALKSELTPLVEEFIKLMKAQKGVTRIDVKIGSLTLKKDDMFTPKDWNKINKHVQKTGDFGIYQKRLSQTLLKEYYEDGIKIKGVEHMFKKSLGYGFKRN